MRCLNEKTTQIIFAIIALEKNSNSYYSSEGKNRQNGQKKAPLAAKKISARD